MRRRSLSVSLLLVSALVVAFTPLAPAVGTTPVPTGNLTSNPSFETNANGWAPWQSTLTRTALTDAPNGSYAMKVARASGTYYTIDDAPDTVPNAIAGTNYTATAYVKAAVTASVGKPIRIVVRERKVVNGALVKETSSTAVNLTTAFQKITVTHPGVKSGEAVDMYVQQDGAVSGNAFYVDLISVTTGAPAPPPDTQAPSIPAGLTLGAVTATSAPLSWTAATDNVGVTGYQVSLNGVAGATVTATSYAFTGLSCGTTYTLGVRARDAAGNLSTAATRSATTGACPDTQAPSAPTALTAGAVTPTSIPLGWAASTDDVGVTGYQVSLNGVPGATVTGTGYAFTGLTCGTTYTLGVRARDAAGNFSDPATATAQTADCPDTQAPSMPANLVSGTVSDTTIPLSWDAATDDVGVTGYQVSLNGVPGATVTATSYAFTGLSCGTTYTLGVRARDAAGNLSAPATASVATSACPIDDEPPTAPTALGVGTPAATSLPLSWTAATDNVGVTGYQVSLNGVDGATVTGHRLHLHRPDLRHHLHPGGARPRRGRQLLGPGHGDGPDRGLPGHPGAEHARQPGERDRERHHDPLELGRGDRRRRGDRLPGLAERRPRGHRNRHQLRLHRPELRHHLHPGREGTRRGRQPLGRRPPPARPPAPARRPRPG